MFQQAGCSRRNTRILGHGQDQAELQWDKRADSRRQDELRRQECSSRQDVPGVKGLEKVEERLKCKEIQEKLATEELGVRRKEYSRRMDCSRRQEHPRGLEIPEDGNLDLEKQWDQMRQSRQFLMEKERDWQALNVKETKRIEAEEKRMRSEMMKSRMKRFGKAGNKKLTALENTLLGNQTKRQLELSEVAQNVARKKKCSSWNTIRSRNIPEGWMRDQPEPQNAGKERDGTKSILRVLEEQWESMETSMTYIEKHEEWMSATWLETSSLEEQRLRLRRQENSRGRKSETREQEMQRKLPAK